MVEHQLPKLAFAGSIPVSRSKQEFAVTLSRLFVCQGDGRLWTAPRRTKSIRCEARANFVWKAHRAVQAQGIYRKGIFPSEPALNDT